jgi:hypothetical protein
MIQQIQELKEQRKQLEDDLECQIIARRSLQAKVQAQVCLNTACA